MQSNTENDAFMNWPALNHSTNEHQTYAGYLRKQGAFFKQWKERYFVLDSVKHQVKLKEYFFFFSNFIGYLTLYFI